jgi:hypothetical protein
MNKILVTTLKTKKECSGLLWIVYVSEGPLRYAHAVTNSTVKAAPANPEKIQSKPITGNTIWLSHGMTYLKVKLAITPAKNPSIAKVVSILILSLITVTLPTQLGKVLFLFNLHNYVYRGYQRLTALRLEI